MTNLTSVTLTSGIPTSGTGTVSTLDALMADGGQATLGALANAANTATDVTPVTGISLWKQISKSVQAVATSVAATLNVQTQAGEFHLGEVGGNSFVVTGNFTRPANTTAYSVGGLVANSVTAGSVVPVQLTVARKNNGTGVICNLRLHKSGTSLTNAQFRIHLFQNSPATTVGDGGTFAGAINGITNVGMGYVDLTMDQQYSDGAKGYAQVPNRVFIPSAGTQNIFALIEARAAYTPVSAEVITLTIEALRD